MNKIHFFMHAPAFLIASTLFLSGRYTKTDEWQTILNKVGTGSSPRMAHLDNDRQIDPIYIYNTNPHDFFGFDGMAIHRRELSIPASRIRWGQYIGYDYHR